MAAPTMSFLPCAEEPPQKQQLSDMIRIVVGDQQRFPKNVLTGSVRNLGVKIRLRIFDELLDRQEILFNRSDAFLPGRIIRRLFRFRPVALWPSGRYMLCIPAEFQNVPLRDPHMLE